MEVKKQNETRKAKLETRKADPSALARDDIAAWCAPLGLRVVTRYPRGGAWMCGKQWTCGRAFLEVWQGKDLAADFADVWQTKGLGKMEKGKRKLGSGQGRRRDMVADLYLTRIVYAITGKKSSRNKKKTSRVESAG